MEYHKIETLFERGDDHKVKPGVYKNPVYAEIRNWRWTEKIDGTNIRLIWKNGVLTFGGRTANANLPAPLVAWLNANVKAERFAEAFGPLSDAVVYGEGYGAGIQQGGLLSNHQRFIVFDVLVGGRYWLKHDDIAATAAQLGLDMVPDYGVEPIDKAAAFVAMGFKSRLNGSQADAEGLVGRPIVPLFEANGKRLIVKLKTRDFK